MLLSPELAEQDTGRDADATLERTTPTQASDQNVIHVRIAREIDDFAVVMRRSLANFRLSLHHVFSFSSMFSIETIPFNDCV